MSSSDGVIKDYLYIRVFQGAKKSLKFSFFEKGSPPILRIFWKTTFENGRLGGSEGKGVRRGRPHSIHNNPL